MSESNGIVVGIVKDLRDPEGIGRVLVEYPHLDSQESNWCRMASPMAGKDRGLFMRPDKGEQVLVCHEHNQANRPFIMGGVWSTDDKPPADDGNVEENNWRFLKSRSGHMILLDDTEGQERIEIISSNNKHRILIDTAGDELRVACESGGITLKAGGDVLIEAANIQAKASGDVNLEAGGAMNIKGSTVNIN